MTMLKTAKSLGLLLAGFLVIASGSALAAILVVDDDGQASATNCSATTPAHTTIGAAIAAASDFDEVLVCPGTYVENIDFDGKKISVRSTGGPAVTTIDGNRAESVVIFAKNETRASRLEGFTIRNGLSTFNSRAFSAGGGIWIRQASPTITGNVITGNEACTGAGIRVHFGSPLIQGNAINLNRQWSGCSGGTGGGGIMVGGAASAEIIGNVISNNTLTSADGGGISLNAAGTPTIKNNVISGNTVSGISPCAAGGGIAIVNVSNAEVVQNIITGNSAGCGGGVSWLVPSGARGPRLVNNTIADNTKTGTQTPGGSGIHAEGFQGQTELINNIIVAKPGQTAVYCGTFNSATPQFKSNDVFSSGGSAYGGICTDQTGSNGNISVDPLFVNAAAGNYHIQPGSPAVDAGDNSAINVPGALNDNIWALITPFDIDGDPRIIDGNNNGSSIVDIGADEIGEKLAARCVGATAVYDPTSTRLIVHSGGLCGGSGHASDVWVLTNGNGVGGNRHWVKVLASGPVATHNHSAVYDAANNRMIVYGGCSGGCFPIQPSTYILTNANGLGGTPVWTQLATTGTPQGRQGHKAFYDAASNRMIVWGGQDGGGSASSQFRQVWVLTNANGLDGSTPTWSRLTTGTTPGVDVPEAAYFSTGVYDPASNRLTVFGGSDGGSDSNAVWVLSNANGLGGAPVWTNTVPRNAAGSPPPRSGAQAIYNATDNTMTIFDGGPSADVWRLTNANGLGGPSTWSQIAVAGGPGGSRVPYNAGAYDAATDAMIVFANNAAGNGNEVWVLRPRGAPIDNIAPTTSASTVPAANAAGWNNSSVNVTLTATDNTGGSGVKSITYTIGSGGAQTVNGTSASFTISAAGVTSIAYQATDKAGNVETAKTLIVRIDTISPTTSAAALPAPNTNGWNNSNVTVTLNATDNTGGSGVRSVSYVITNGSSSSGTTVTGASVSFTVSAEGVNIITYEAVDVAGNVEVSKTLTVRIDKTAPATTATRSPPANSAGWNNTDVTVTLAATDNVGGSGVQLIGYSINGVPAPIVPGSTTSFVVSTEGVHTIAYRATDVAGNVETAKTLTVQIDKTAPNGTLSLTPNMLWPPNHRLVTIGQSRSTTDNLSGVASVSGPVVTSNEPQDGLGDGDTSPDWVLSGNTLQLRAERAGGGSGRVYTVTYTLVDRAGNTWQISATVTVPHDRR